MCWRPPRLKRTHTRCPYTTLFQSPDGRDKVVALSRVEPFGWTVGIELPADGLARAALRSLLPTLAVGGILVVLSAALAAVAAQRIADRKSTRLNSSH